jgi:hypothetical protein
VQVRRGGARDNNPPSHPFLASSSWMDRQGCFLKPTMSTCSSHSSEYLVNIVYGRTSEDRSSHSDVNDATHGMRSRRDLNKTPFRFTKYRVPHVPGELCINHEVAYKTTHVTAYGFPWTNTLTRIPTISQTLEEGRSEDQ